MKEFLSFILLFLFTTGLAALMWVSVEFWIEVWMLLRRWIFG